MISEKIRNLLLSKDPKYTYCNLTSHLLTDDDLIELADLVEPNPYITHIDLAYNPDITINGFTRLQERLPSIKIINCCCFLTIEEAMEHATLPRRLPSVPFDAVFPLSYKFTAQSPPTDVVELTEHDAGSKCKL